MNDATTEEFADLEQIVAQAHHKLNTLSVPRTQETTGRLLTAQERLTWYREYLIARWTGATVETWEAVALAEQRLLMAGWQEDEKPAPVSPSLQEVEQALTTLCANVAEMRAEMQQMRRSEGSAHALAAP